MFRCRSSRDFDGPTDTVRPDRTVGHHRRRRRSTEAWGTNNSHPPLWRRMRARQGSTTHSSTHRPAWLHPGPYWSLVPGRNQWRGRPSSATRLVLHRRPSRQGRDPASRLGFLEDLSPWYRKAEQDGHAGHVQDPVPRQGPPRQRYSCAEGNPAWALAPSDPIVCSQREQPMP